MFYKVTSMLIAIAIGSFLWFHGCIYLAIIAHSLYPNSLYAVAYNEETENYHAYLFINEQPKDPQTLFLWLTPNVDYYNPEFTTKSTSELLNKTYTFFKSK